MEEKKTTRKIEKIANALKKVDKGIDKTRNIVISILGWGASIIAVIALFGGFNEIAYKLGTHASPDNDENYIATATYTADGGAVGKDAPPTVSDNLDRFYVGETITFANDMSITVLEAGSAFDEISTYAYITIEAANNGSETVELPYIDFYADDYKLEGDIQPEEAWSENIAGETLSPGRKIKGTYYRQCEEFYNADKVEAEFGKAIIVIKDSSMVMEPVEEVIKAGDLVYGNYSYEDSANNLYYIANVRLVTEGGYLPYIDFSCYYNDELKFMETRELIKNEDGTYYAELPDLNTTILLTFTEEHGAGVTINTDPNSINEYLKNADGFYRSNNGEEVSGAPAYGIYVYDNGIYTCKAVLGYYTDGDCEDYINIEVMDYEGYRITSFTGTLQHNADGSYTSYSEDFNATLTIIVVDGGMEVIVESSDFEDTYCMNGFYNFESELQAP